MFDPSVIADVSKVVVGIGISVNAAELLQRRMLFADDQVFGSAALLSTHPKLAARTRTSRLPLVALSYDLLVVVLATELVAGLSLLLPLPRAVVIVALVWSFASRCFDMFRNRYGFEGSDQMRVLVLAGLITYFLYPDQWMGYAGLVFVGLESIWSYVAAGWVKIVSSDWRTGVALRAVFSSRQFGSNTIARRIATGPTPKLMSWVTLGFECFGWVLLFLGPPGILAFVTVAVLFHLGIALSMGFNGFVWSFVAALPCVAYTAGLLY